MAARTRRRGLAGAAVLALAVLTGGAVFAEGGAEPAPACATMNATLPPMFPEWTAPSKLTAAADLQGVSAAQAEVGKAYAVALGAAGKVHYPATPGKPSAVNDQGGLVGFQVSQAGDYEVALSGPVWVDVVKGQSAIASGDHGHGVPCTTIRKFVVFILTPGTYVLQLSASPAASVEVMVAKKP